MDLQWTGERMETFIFSDVTFEHLHRYAFANCFAKHKTVLDIACGEGYGTNLLAEKAAEVTGVDIDQATIHAAKNKYTRPNLKFETGSATNIPLPDASFDLVVSFETIEHIDQHDEMLKEIKRVLKKSGLFIISTPDKKYTTEIKPFKNPFHKKELYKQELDTLLRRNFKQVKFLQQNFIHGSILIGEDQNGFGFFTGNYQKIISHAPEAMYWVALASDEDLPGSFSSFFYNHEMYDEIVSQEIQAVKRTYTYRLAQFLLSPFRWFRLIFKSR